MHLTQKQRVTAEVKIIRKDGTVEVQDVELDEESIQQILAMNAEEISHADRMD